jgi:hypothetical protein
VDKLSKTCQSSTEKIVNIDPLNESVGSDFFTSLNSILNERDFKMAFLNIVSLPKKIDEIRYSMSNKHIDLIGFNETRLDSNISDNMIDLDGHDIVRKDRSRNGGGVCICSDTNLSVRSDN